MSRKLRPKNVTIANQWQIDRIADQLPEGAIELTQAAIEDLEEVRLKHGPLATVAACLGLLDGIEHERGHLADVIKAWHKRAVLGTRSWEAN